MLGQQMNSPMGLKYQAIETRLIIAVTCPSKRSLLKQVVKAFAACFYTTNITPTLEKIKTCNNAFYTAHSLETLRDSVRHYQKTPIKVMVLSKFTSEQVSAVGIPKLMHQESEKLSFSDRVGIDKIENIKDFFDSLYSTKASLSLTGIGDAFAAVLLATLANEQIPYGVMGDHLKVNASGLSSSKMAAVSRFINKLTRFTDSSKVRDYRDLSKEQKEKTTQEAFL